MAITDRAERSEKQSEIQEQAVEKFLDQEDDNTKAIKLALSLIHI